MLSWLLLLALQSNDYRLNITKDYTTGRMENTLNLSQQTSQNFQLNLNLNNSSYLYYNIERYRDNRSIAGSIKKNIGELSITTLFNTSRIENGNFSRVTSSINTNSYATSLNQTKSFAANKQFSWLTEGGVTNYQDVNYEDNALNFRSNASYIWGEFNINMDQNLNKSIATNLTDKFNQNDYQRSIRVSYKTIKAGDLSLSYSWNESQDQSLTSNAIMQTNSNNASLSTQWKTNADTSIYTLALSSDLRFNHASNLLSGIIREDRNDIYTYNGLSLKLKPVSWGDLKFDYTNKYLQTQDHIFARLDKQNHNNTISLSFNTKDNKFSFNSGLNLDQTFYKYPILNNKDLDQLSGRVGFNIKSESTPLKSYFSFNYNHYENIFVSSQLSGSNYTRNNLTVAPSLAYTTIGKINLSYVVNFSITSTEYEFRENSDFLSIRYSATTNFRANPAANLSVDISHSYSNNRDGQSINPKLFDFTLSPSNKSKINGFRLGVNYTPMQWQINANSYLEVKDNWRLSGVTETSSNTIYKRFDLNLARGFKLNNVNFSIGAGMIYQEGYGILREQDKLTNSISCSINTQPQASPKPTVNQPVAVNLL